MSIERDLLKRVISGDDLAKQVKQEPVAWKVIDETNGGVYVF